MCTHPLSYYCPSTNGTYLITTCASIQGGTGTPGWAAHCVICLLSFSTKNWDWFNHVIHYVILQNLYLFRCVQNMHLIKLIKYTSEYLLRLELLRSWKIFPSLFPNDCMKQSRLIVLVWTLFDIYEAASFIIRHSWY